MRENPRILLFDNDDTASRYFMEELMIKGNCSVSCASDIQAALGDFSQNSFDVVIAKFGKPELDTPGFLKALKKIDPDCVVIAFFENDNPGLLREISKLGIYDFIVKPVNLEKLFFLIKKGVELHSLTAAHRKLMHGFQEQSVNLQKQNTLLAKRIEESTKNLVRLYEDLRSTYMRTIKALAQAIDARDHYTHSHSENVAKCAVLIAQELGLSANETELIREACELHDLGKIGIQDSILSKPSSLTEEEWKQVKLHPQTAAQILEPLTFLGAVVELVRQHHEHYDGGGYPKGLRGEEILLGARIINLADAYDAMRSARSYREIPFSQEEAILEIKKNNGIQFDPKVVEAFLKIVDEL